MFGLFGHKDCAVQNWRSKAWSIDPHKTRILILN